MKLLVGSPGGIKSTGRGSEVDHPESVGESNLVILRVLITILDTSSDPRALAVACFDISVFVQQRPAGSSIGTDLKAKERVIKLMNHESAEVTKNALLCIQRLFLGARYASVLQAYRCIPLNVGAEQWGSVF
ncbi:hypothetical protein ACFX2F_002242 [Malus domestica]